MIRMFLFAAGFLMITIALLLFQPGAGNRLPTPIGEPVTRAEPGLPVAPAPMPDRYQQTAAPAAPVRTVPRVAVPGANLDDQSLRRMTWDTLSNISRATGKESAPGQPGSVLHTIVKRSLNDTESPTVAARTPLAAPKPMQPKPQATANVYVVQPGDSLVTIADRIYGDVNMTGPLFAANQAILGRPDDLRPGQTLVLPNR